MYVTLAIVLSFIAENELSAVRDIYFQKKDKIFGGKWKIPENTAAMEELTQEYFTEDQCMSSVSHPKYDTCTCCLTSHWHASFSTASRSQYIIKTCCLWYLSLKAMFKVCVCTHFAK